MTHDYYSLLILCFSILTTTAFKLHVWTFMIPSLYKLLECCCARIHIILKCRMYIMQSDRYNALLNWCSHGTSKVLWLLIPTISQTYTHIHTCVCSCVYVGSCDIWSELSLLSAQWSCEFNLSGTINLSTAGCRLYVLCVTHMWSLTSIYGADKGGVTVLKRYNMSCSLFVCFVNHSFQLRLRSSFIWLTINLFDMTKQTFSPPALFPPLVISSTEDCYWMFDVGL